MSTQKKNQLKEIMLLAWQFVRKNGFTMDEALKVSMGRENHSFVLQHNSIFTAP